MAGKPTKKPLYPIPLFIKKIAEEKGIKQIEIAKKSKHEPSYISAILNGQKKATDEMLLEILIHGCDLRPTEAEEALRGWKKELILNEKEKFIQNHFIQIEIMGEIINHPDLKGEILYIVNIEPREENNNKSYQLNFFIKNKRIKREITLVSWKNNHENVNHLKEKDFFEKLKINKQTLLKEVIISEIKLTIGVQNKLNPKNQIAVPRGLLEGFIKGWDYVGKDILKNMESNRAQRLYDLGNDYVRMFKDELNASKKNSEYLSELEQAINLYLQDHE